MKNPDALNKHTARTPLKKSSLSSRRLINPVFHWTNKLNFSTVSKPSPLVYAKTIPAPAQKEAAGLPHYQVDANPRRLHYIHRARPARARSRNNDNYAINRGALAIARGLIKKAPPMRYDDVARVWVEPRVYTHHARRAYNVGRGNWYRKQNARVYGLLWQMRARRECVLVFIVFES